MSDIDRSEVIEYAKQKRYELIEFWEDYKHENREVKYYDFIINSLETDEAYQLEYEKPEFCEDCISREQTLKSIVAWSDEEIIRNLPSVTPQGSRKGYLSIDDVMSVFDDFMCGEVDEEGTETFLEMLKDKVEIEPQESEDKG